MYEDPSGAFPLFEAPWKDIRKNIRTIRNKMSQKEEYVYCRKFKFGVLVLLAQISYCRSTYVRFYMFVCWQTTAFRTLFMFAFRWVWKLVLINAQNVCMLLMFSFLTQQQNQRTLLECEHLLIYSIPCWYIISACIIINYSNPFSVFSLWPYNHIVSHTDEVVNILSRVHDKELQKHCLTWWICRNVWIRLKLTFKPYLFY